MQKDFLVHYLKGKAFSGTTSVYSEAENRPYLLLPVIPSKKA